MRSKPHSVTAGMEVLDETAQHVGQVQDVSEQTVLVRIEREMAVPLDAIDAVTDNWIVLPLRIDLADTAKVTPSSDEVPDPSIFLS